MDLHDENYFCAKTIHDWLFNGDNGVDESRWQKTLKQINFGNKFVENRPFSCTERSIQNSFTELVNRQWLGKNAIAIFKILSVTILSLVYHHKQKFKTFSKNLMLLQQKNLKLSEN